MTRFIYLLIFISVNISVKAQSTYPSNELLKKEIYREDTTLTKLFKIYIQKQQLIEDYNTIIQVNSFVDSTNKYIGLTRYYLDRNMLDSCIEMIHKTYSFINNSKQRLDYYPNYYPK